MASVMQAGLIKSLLSSVLVCGLMRIVSVHCGSCQHVRHHAAAPLHCALRYVRSSCSCQAIQY